MPMTRSACVLTLMLLSPAWARSLVASYPDKPVRLVVPFTPVIYIGYSPNIIVAAPKFPPASAKELVACAKANPGKVNWAPGSAGHPPVRIAMRDTVTRRSGAWINQQKKCRSPRITS